VVLTAERVVPAKLKPWWTPKQENRLMAAVECMEVYQQSQRHRKVKIRVELQRDVECLLIGQKGENFFPNMRVRRGLHMHRPKVILGFHENVEVLVSKLEMIQNTIYDIVVQSLDVQITS